MSQQGINPELIVTLGPSSLEPAILKKIAARGVNYVRLNLSHTPLDQIESTIAHVRNTIDVDLILDTEGPQIRTGPLIDGERLLAPGQEVLLGETEE